MSGMKLEVMELDIVLFQLSAISVDNGFGYRQEKKPKFNLIYSFCSASAKMHYKMDDHLTFHGYCSFL